MRVVKVRMYDDEIEGVDRLAAQMSMTRGHAVRYAVLCKLPSAGRPHRRDDDALTATRITALEAGALPTVERLVELARSLESIGPCAGACAVCRAGVASLVQTALGVCEPASLLFPGRAVEATDRSTGEIFAAVSLGAMETMARLASEVRPCTAPPDCGAASCVLARVVLRWAAEHRAGRR